MQGRTGLLGVVTLLVTHHHLAVFFPRIGIQWHRLCHLLVLVSAVFLLIVFLKLTRRLRVLLSSHIACWLLAILTLLLLLKLAIEAVL